eukprot:TRINITY_DN10441_c0_g1_i2.p1 TRINITY_DN10441_c0_g1~~TRINITY_DN10441_c0_g1_i2.p1  ORF type:complete len:489 (+),score=97.60 TRINITY_DN10441_c0_g1_i2:73-1539(+)
MLGFFCCSCRDEPENDGVKDKPTPSEKDASLREENAEGSAGAASAGTQNEVVPSEGEDKKTSLKTPVDGGTAAAMTLQSNKGESKGQDKKVNPKNTVGEEAAAATTIQSHYRGKSVRKNVTFARTDNEKKRLKIKVFSVRGLNESSGTSTKVGVDQSNPCVVVECGYHQRTTDSVGPVWDEEFVMTYTADLPLTFCVFKLVAKHMPTMVLGKATLQLSDFLNGYDGELKLDATDRRNKEAFLKVGVRFVAGTGGLGGITTWTVLSKAIGLRAGPGLQTQLVGIDLQPNEEFDVVEVVEESSGQTFLRLADRRGWAFKKSLDDGELLVEKRDFSTSPAVGPPIPASSTTVQEKPTAISSKSEMKDQDTIASSPKVDDSKPADVARSKSAPTTPRRGFFGRKNEKEVVATEKPGSASRTASVPASKKTPEEASKAASVEPLKMASPQASKVASPQAPAAKAPAAEASPASAAATTPRKGFFSRKAATAAT